MALSRRARCVLTDSGTVQEECTILHIPNVTLRETTERPETVEIGANLVAGCDVDRILRCIAIATDGPPRWQVPPEYVVPAVADTVVRILAGRLPLGVPGPDAPPIG